MKGMFFNAGVLFTLAKRAYERTAEASSDREPGKQDALVAIVFSVAALEAFINETAEFANYPICASPPEAAYVPAYGEVMKQIEESHGSIQIKFQLARWVFTGRAFDKGAQPYQDFDLLLDLRNALVHLRPLDIFEPTMLQLTAVNPPPIIHRLQFKSILAEFGTKLGASWVNRISTRAVARWACNAAAGMVRSFLASAPESGFKKVMELNFKRDFQPIE